MPKKNLVEISTVFEIGGHTYDHIPLVNLNYLHLKKQISDAKKSLEDIIGKSINSFCFPKGKYDSFSLNYLNNSDFLFGRTTQMCHLSKNSIAEKKLMHTSKQFYDHSYYVLFRHLLKYKNFDCISNISQINKNLLQYFDLILNGNFIEKDIYFHLWGHSWEIEKLNKWEELRLIFKFINENRLHFNLTTNTNFWHLVKS